MNDIHLFREATKMICAACAIFAQVALAGCAGPRITALDVEIARAQAEAQRACYAAHMPPEYADARDAALVAMAINAHTKRARMWRNLVFGSIFKK